MQFYPMARSYIAEHEQCRVGLCGRRELAEAAHHRVHVFLFSGQECPSFTRIEVPGVFVELLRSYPFQGRR